MSAAEAPAAGATVCLGEILAEWIFRSPTGLPANRTVIAEKVGRELGGAALNVSWYFGQLGRSCRLVAPIGRADRETARTTLASCGIESGGLVPVPGDTDTLFTVLSKEAHRSVYALSSWPAGTRELLLERCSGAQSLILNGGRHPEIRDCYRTLARTGAAPLLTFNPSYAIFEYARDELAAIFEKAQVTVLNGQEFEFLERNLGKLEPQRLATNPPQIVAVTLGREGVRVLSAEDSFELPSFTSRDGVAIGAGDAFFAGFLHRFLEGAPLRESTRHGLALAAIVVESNRVRTAVSAEEVQRRMS